MWGRFRQPRLQPIIQMRFARLILQYDASTNGPNVDQSLIDEQALSALLFIALYALSYSLRFASI
jgi:hypothetical protein